MGSIFKHKLGLLVFFFRRIIIFQYFKDLKWWFDLLLLNQTYGIFLGRYIFSDELHFLINHLYIQQSLPIPRCTLWVIQIEMVSLHGWKCCGKLCSFQFPLSSPIWLSADFHILNCFHLILRQNSLQAKVSYMSLWLWKLERKILDKKGKFFLVD